MRRWSLYRGLHRAAITGTAQFCYKNCPGQFLTNRTRWWLSSSSARYTWRDYAARSALRKKSARGMKIFEWKIPKENQKERGRKRERGGKREIGREIKKLNTERRYEKRKREKENSRSREGLAQWKKRRRRTWGTWEEGEKVDKKKRSSKLTAASGRPGSRRGVPFRPKTLVPSFSPSQLLPMTLPSFVSLLLLPSRAPRPLTWPPSARHGSTTGSRSLHSKRDKWAASVCVTCPSVCP